MRVFAQKFAFMAAVITGITLYALSNNSVFTKAYANSDEVVSSNNHVSHLRLESVPKGGVKRQVKIGLNKSMVVELPVDIRDVLVSNPEVMDAVIQTTVVVSNNSRRAYVVAKKVGEANAFFFNGKGEMILTLEVTISRDMGTLTSIYKRLIPHSDIKVDVVNEHLVLSGAVRRPADATKAADIAARFVKKKDQVINLLKSTANEQVLLQVKVAEIERSAVKQFGSTLNKILSKTGGKFQYFGSSNHPSTFVGEGNSLLGVPASLPSSITDAASILGGNYTSGATTITSMLRFMESNGVLRTLAEPNLTAISGETANFLAGGEFPIPLQDDDGVTVEFKKFGVGLGFSPIVLDENRISLKIETEVSELSDRGAVRIANFTIPGLKVRRASTTVEIPTGGSLVMAGLISESTRNNLDDLPGLKRLPILGALFRSRDFQRDESELVIIVTPYLVNPTSKKKLTIPGKDYEPASDRDAILRGHMNRVPKRRRERSYKDSMREVRDSRRGDRGNFGFIID